MTKEEIMKFWRIVLVFFVIIQMTFAQAKIQPKDLLDLKYPRQLSVHPQRSQFVFTIRIPDFQNSKWHTQLWYLENCSAQPRRLTFSINNDKSPQWSPDGNWIAFISDREYIDASGHVQSGVEQLWLLDMRGGDPQQLTALDKDVEEYEWSPDGRFLIVLTEASLPDSAKIYHKRREKMKFDEVVKDSVQTNKIFLLVNPADKTSRIVAELDPGVDNFSLSNDGKWIVYQTNYTGKYNDEQKYDLWLLQIYTGEKFQLTDFPGPETQPRFSPDDRWITYINQTTPDIEFAETDLARIAFDIHHLGKPDTLTITKDLHRSILDYRWCPDGKSLIIQVAEGTETHLYRLNLKNKKKKYQKITPLAGNVIEISSVNQKEQLYYLWENANHLPEIAFLEKGKQKLLTNYSKQLEKFHWGSQKIYRWKSVDGEQIEGLLFLPVNFDPKKKYPLILTVHGGPYGRFRQAFRQYNFPQLFTSDDYVVFAPNPRGSSGYDDAFGKAIWYKVGGHMGGIDFQDIMSGIDSLISEGFIDEARMGVTGGSYGGFLTNWIISQTDRFAAAVSKFGIFSLFTDWSNSWQPAWEKMYLGIYYWEKPINQDHPYVKYSPAFYVNRIKTPVLILHGSKDRYTNLANSQEMYQALNTLGRDVKFVVYPRENHGINKEPNHFLDSIRRTKKWFDKYLKK